MSSKKKIEDISFEDAINQLEDIANTLEEGELDLDDSIKQFELGIKLSKICHKKLSEAEKKITILQSGDDGEVDEQVVTVRGETGELEDDNIQGTLL